jgi:pyridoxine 4-dehydrogenase
MVEVNTTPNENGASLVSGPAPPSDIDGLNFPPTRWRSAPLPLRPRGILRPNTPHHRFRRKVEEPGVDGSDPDATEQTKVRGDSRPLGPFSVSPVGFGTMRLTGPNALGPPRDRSEALAVLRQAVNLGVDHIDTAEFYGPTVVNELIRQALHPYPSELILVSKVGARRDRHGGVLIDDAPQRLRRGIEDNLRTLGVDALAVVNLRRVRSTGPDAFFDDQLDAMITARDDGLIKAIGLSNVTIAHLRHAVRFTEVACVQNAFHLKSRQSDPVLKECTRRNIAFVPFAPLGSGASGPDSVLGAPQVIREAARLHITPAQVVLAWSLATSQNVLLIPGTASMDHLQENLAASSNHLDFEAIRRLSLVR